VQGNLLHADAGQVSSRRASRIEFNLGKIAEILRLLY
jgi:hypothetical protein